MMNKPYELTCDVCDRTMCRSVAIQHFEGPCGQGNNVQYLLKMAHLHEIKAHDVLRPSWVQLSDLLNGRMITLVKGVCFYCPTPIDHENGLCRKASRVDYYQKILTETMDSYFWNLENYFVYLRKAQVAILAQKHRNEMAADYERYMNTIEVRQGKIRVKEGTQKWPMSDSEKIFQMRREKDLILKNRNDSLKQRFDREYEFIRGHRLREISTRIKRCIQEDSINPVKFLRFVNDDPRKIRPASR